MSNPANATAAPPPPWYRQFWPWLLISIPLATVVAGILTIWVASREPVALVHDDYYKEGLAVNQDLARDHQAARWRLRAALTVNVADGVIYGQVDGDAAVSDMTAIFIHPVASRYDQAVQVRVSQDGHFTLPVPKQGKRWYLELRGENSELRGDSSELRGESNQGWRLQGVVPIERDGTVHLTSQDPLHTERTQRPTPAPQR